MHSNNHQCHDDIDSEQQVLVQTRQLLTMTQTKICDVWASNFDEQMKRLLGLIEKYPVIAMVPYLSYSKDTQFPGIFASRSQYEQRCYNEEDSQYILIRRNVEQTKMIQIGLSIADEDGNVPYPVCTWQFNFRWDKEKQKIVMQSFDLLKRAGVRFDKLVTEGIEFHIFAEYFAGSGTYFSTNLGLILNKKTKWIVFHGSSDFAYLLRLVLGQQLPPTIDQFYKAMRLYFPVIYDLKYIIKDVPSLKDVGLAKLSYQIGCSRIGPQHQAGSDSLLTLCCYFKMLDQSQIFGQRQFQNCINVIFGVGIGYMKNTIGNYQQREHMDSSSSYVQRNDYGYYDNRSSMYHMNQYGVGNNYGGTGPLYNYLQGQTQYHMMYPPPPERRY